MAGLKLTQYAHRAARWRVPLHFVVAAVVLVFAQPSGAGLVVGGVLVAVGLALRGWAAGHLRKPQRDGGGITTSGPYAYLRHPLYLGSALLLAGFALAAGRWGLTILLAAYFLFLFLPVMHREEQALREQFPDRYAAYRAAVPALLPRLRRARRQSPGSAHFSLVLYLANREWRALLGCAVLLLLLYSRLRGVF